MVFVSSLVLSKWENLALLSLYTFWGKCVYFSILNDKIHNYVKQNIIVDFIIQKLKNIHTFLKKYSNWAKLSSLILTEREETKNKYFAPMVSLGWILDAIIIIFDLPCTASLWLLRNLLAYKQFLTIRNRINYIDPVSNIGLCCL